MVPYGPLGGSCGSHELTRSLVAFEGSGFWDLKVISVNFTLRIPKYSVFAIRVLASLLYASAY